MHFWLIRPELEAGIKNREADRHWPSPNYPWPIAAEVVFWLLRLVAAETVCQSFVVTYGPAVVGLHIQSLRKDG